MFYDSVLDQVHDYEFEELLFTAVLVYEKFASYSSLHWLYSLHFLPLQRIPFISWKEVFIVGFP